MWDACLAVIADDIVAKHVCARRGAISCHLDCDADL